MPEAAVPIRIVRGQRVILDNDLARLYGVRTGALNQAVKRMANASQKISSSGLRATKWMH